MKRYQVISLADASPSLGLVLPLSLKEANRRSLVNVWWLSGDSRIAYSRPLAALRAKGVGAHHFADLAHLGASVAEAVRDSPDTIGVGDEVLVDVSGGSAALAAQAITAFPPTSHPEARVIRLGASGWEELRRGVWVECVGERALHLSDAVPSPKDVSSILSVHIGEGTFTVPSGYTPAAILELARHILTLYVDFPDRAKRLRAILASGSADAGEAGPKNDLRIPIEVTPGPEVVRTLKIGRIRALKEGRLTREFWLLDPDSFERWNAFLRGGWLEVVAEEAIARSWVGAAPRRNLTVGWTSHFDPANAEIDVVFPFRGRLHLVSCKNEFSHRRVGADMWRLRALVAELGESAVRAFLFATDVQDDHNRHLAAAFEIGLLDGPRMLKALRAALDGDPTSLRRALVGGDAPAPGRATAVAMQEGPRPKTPVKRSTVAKRKSVRRIRLAHRDEGDE